jgi:hypothetical protein
MAPTVPPRLRILAPPLVPEHVQSMSFSFFLLDTLSPSSNGSKALLIPLYPHTHTSFLLFLCQGGEERTLLVPTASIFAFIPTTMLCSHHRLTLVQYTSKPKKFRAICPSQRSSCLPFKGGNVED